jgi:hypothetical protein
MDNATEPNGISQQVMDEFKSSLRENDAAIPASSESAVKSFFSEKIGSISEFFSKNESVEETTVENNDKSKSVLETVVGSKWTNLRNLETDATASRFYSKLKDEISSDVCGVVNSAFDHPAAIAATIGTGVTTAVAAWSFSTLDAREAQFNTAIAAALTASISTAVYISNEQRKMVKGPGMTKPQFIGGSPFAQLGLGIGTMVTGSVALGAIAFKIKDTIRLTNNTMSKSEAGTLPIMVGAQLCLGAAAVLGLVGLATGLDTRDFAAITSTANQVKNSFKIIQDSFFVSDADKAENEKLLNKKRVETENSIKNSIEAWETYLQLMDVDGTTFQAPVEFHKHFNYEWEITDDFDAQVRALIRNQDFIVEMNKRDDMKDPHTFTVKVVAEKEAISSSEGDGLAGVTNLIDAINTHCDKHSETYKTASLIMAAIVTAGAASALAYEMIYGDTVLPAIKNASQNVTNALSKTSEIVNSKLSATKSRLEAIREGRDNRSRGDRIRDHQRADAQRDAQRDYEEYKRDVRSAMSDNDRDAVDDLVAQRDLVYDTMHDMRSHGSEELWNKNRGELFDILGNINKSLHDYYAKYADNWVRTEPTAKVSSIGQASISEPQVVPLDKEEPQAPILVSPASNNSPLPLSTPTRTKAQKKRDQKRRKIARAKAAEASEKEAFNSPVQDAHKALRKSSTKKMSREEFDAARARIVARNKEFGIISYSSEEWDALSSDEKKKVVASNADGLKKYKASKTTHQSLSLHTPLSVSSLGSVFVSLYHANANNKGSNPEFFGTAHRSKYDGVAHFTLCEHQLIDGVYVVVRGIKHPLPMSGWTVLNKDDSDHSLVTRPISSLKFGNLFPKAENISCGAATISKHRPCTFVGLHPITYELVVTGTTYFYGAGETFLTHSATTANHSCGSLLVDSQTNTIVGHHDSTVGPDPKTGQNNMASALKVVGSAQ